MELPQRPQKDNELMKSSWKDDIISSDENVNPHKYVLNMTV